MALGQDEFLAVLRSSLLDGSCRKVVLSRPRGGVPGEQSGDSTAAPAPPAPLPEAGGPSPPAPLPEGEGRNDVADRVTVRAVRLGDRDVYQFAWRSGGRETHENLSPPEASERCVPLAGDVYRDCHLFTAEGDYSARVGRGGQWKVKRSGPTMAATAESHDRTKRRLLEEGSPIPFLVEIDVMTPTGKVRASQQKKFRQINRFAELVDDIVAELPAEGRLRVVDFGCGKSYLTFALEHLLTRVHGREVEIIGLDRNAEVIRRCSDVAARLGCEGLTFRVGEIADLAEESPIDLAVSLHACDTATDDALAAAIARQAKVILAVPCCQHEIAGKMDGERLELIGQHGILKERFASLATDSLRAQLLELCGYRTQVVEFIDMQHTAKNLLIRAVRREGGVPALEKREREYEEFKSLLGVDGFRLEEALGDAGVVRGGARSG